MLHTILFALVITRIVVCVPTSNTHQAKAALDPDCPSEDNSYDWHVAHQAKATLDPDCPSEDNSYDWHVTHRAKATLDPDCPSEDNSYDWHPGGPGSDQHAHHDLLPVADIVSHDHKRKTPSESDHQEGQAAKRKKCGPDLGKQLRHELWQSPQVDPVITRMQQWILKTTPRNHPKLTKRDIERIIVVFGVHAVQIQRHARKEDYTELVGWFFKSASNEELAKSIQAVRAKISAATNVGDTLSGTHCSDDSYFRKNFIFIENSFVATQVKSQAQCQNRQKHINEFPRLVKMQYLISKGILSDSPMGITSNSPLHYSPLDTIISSCPLKPTKQNLDKMFNDEILRIEKVSIHPPTVICSACMRQARQEARTRVHRAHQQLQAAVA